MFRFLSVGSWRRAVTGFPVLTLAGVPALPVRGYLPVLTVARIQAARATPYG